MSGERAPSSAGLPLRPESEVPTADILGELRSFKSREEHEVALQAQALMMLSRSRGSAEALNSLMELGRSEVPATRRSAFFMLLGHLDRPEVCDLVRQGLSDSDERIAVAAARGVLRAAHDPAGQWAGPPLSSMVHEPSIHPSADGLLALAAWRLGVVGSEDRFLSCLVSSGTSGRLDLLSSLEFAGLGLGRVEPQLVEDPSARVRVRLLLALREPLQGEVARTLRDDPLAWVRARARPSRTVRGLVRRRRTPGTSPGCALGKRRRRGGPRQSRSAGPRSGGDQHSEIRRLRRSDHRRQPCAGRHDRREVERSVRTARADAYGRFISEPGSPIRRVQLVRSFRDIGDPQALRLLVRLSSPSEEKDAQVRESCVEEACLFIGFAPREGVRSFLSDHANGLVTGAELAPQASGD